LKGRTTTKHQRRTVAVAGQQSAVAGIKAVKVEDDEAPVAYMKAVTVWR
jgi:hypothetical protein